MCSHVYKLCNTTLSGRKRIHSCLSTQGFGWFGHDRRINRAEANILTEKASVEFERIYVRRAIRLHTQQGQNERAQLVKHQKAQEHLYYHKFNVDLRRKRLVKPAPMPNLRQAALTPGASAFGVQHAQFELQPTLRCLIFLEIKRSNASWDAKQGPSIVPGRTRRVLEDFERLSGKRGEKSGKSGCSQFISQQMQVHLDVAQNIYQRQISNDQ